MTLIYNNNQPLNLPILYGEKVGFSSQPTKKRKKHAKKDHLLGWTTATHRRRLHVLDYVSNSNSEEDPQWFSLSDMKDFYKYTFKEVGNISIAIKEDLNALLKEGFIKIIGERGNKRYTEIQIQLTGKQIPEEKSAIYLHPVYLKLMKDKNLTEPELFVFITIKAKPNSFSFSHTLRTLKNTNLELTTILKKLEALNLIQRKDHSQSFVEASKYQILFKEKGKK